MATFHSESDAITITPAPEGTEVAAILAAVASAARQARSHGIGLVEDRWRMAGRLEAQRGLIPAARVGWRR